MLFSSSLKRPVQGLRLALWRMQPSEALLRRVLQAIPLLQPVQAISQYGSQYLVCCILKAHWSVIARVLELSLFAGLFAWLKPSSLQIKKLCWTMQELKFLWLKSMELSIWMTHLPQYSTLESQRYPVLWQDPRFRIVYSMDCTCIVSERIRVGMRLMDTKQSMVEIMRQEEACLSSLQAHIKCPSMMYYNVQQILLSGPDLPMHWKTPRSSTVSPCNVQDVNSLDLYERQQFSNLKDALDQLNLITSPLLSCGDHNWGTRNMYNENQLTSKNITVGHNNSHRVIFEALGSGTIKLAILNLAGDQDLFLKQQVLHSNDLRIQAWWDGGVSMDGKWPKGRSQNCKEMWANQSVDPSVDISLAALWCLEKLLDKTIPVHATYLFGETECYGLQIAFPMPFWESACVRLAYTGTAEFTKLQTYVDQFSEQQLVQLHQRLFPAQSHQFLAEYHDCQRNIRQMSDKEYVEKLVHADSTYRLLYARIFFLLILFKNAELLEACVLIIYQVNQKCIHLFSLVCFKVDKVGNIWIWICLIMNEFRDMIGRRQSTSTYPYMNAVQFCCVLGWLQRDGFQNDLSVLYTTNWFCQRSTHKSRLEIASATCLSSSAITKVQDMAQKCRNLFLYNKPK